jgi:predicted O-linked N-acetylglucosamine transferase (SPINDLY family)
VATADELFHRALVAHQAGDRLAAEATYRQLLDVLPDHAAALTNLGSLVAKRGDTDEALALYRRATAADPDQLDARFNLGNLYRRLGRARDAATEYEHVLRLAPNAPQALVNLGLVAGDLGEWPRAVECLARAATVAPDLPDTLLLLAEALARCGRLDESVGACREAVARFPDYARAHNLLGVQLGATGATEEAAGAFERAVALDPNYAEAHNGLGVALDALGRTDDALCSYGEAVRLNPDHARAWANLGTGLAQEGRTADATGALRRALALAPAPDVHGTLLATLVYGAELTPEQLRDEHVAWADAHANALAPVEPPRKRPAGAPGRVRVGYVFGGFRSRAAAGFLEALLTHHDRARFHVTAYASAAPAGADLDRLRKLADSWKPVARLIDEDLARAIRADEIDVLVDLHGHTPANRLLAFARKPAPVQIALFGYPATTGLRALDFRVTDTTADPPGLTEAHYVEKLLRLPDLGWVYAPPADAPVPNALPAARGRAFTFGCLNHPGKLSDPCVAAWAAILKAVPKSRLVLLAGRSVAGADQLAARFTAHGVASDRLELVYRLPAGDYFAAYQPIDLALDPFPYNGGATTCDALWMGVPVLTVAGREARARQGVSVLNALGLPEFVADTPEQLVTLAATWADQRDSLADLRGTIREIVGASAVTSAPAFVKHLEAAYLSV